MKRKLDEDPRHPLTSSSPFSLDGPDESSKWVMEGEERHDHIGRHTLITETGTSSDTINKLGELNMQI